METKFVFRPDATTNSLAKSLDGNVGAARSTTGSTNANELQDWANAQKLHLRKGIGAVSLSKSMDDEPTLTAEEAESSFRAHIRVRARQWLKRDRDNWEFRDVLTKDSLADYLTDDVLECRVWNARFAQAIRSIGGDDKLKGAVLQEVNAVIAADVAARAAATA